MRQQASRGGCVHALRRVVVPVLVAVTLAAPAGAQAATVRLDKDPGEGRTPPSQRLEFDAAPGEANRLTVTYDGAAFVVDDVVAVVPGLNCRQLDPGDVTRARCAGSDGGDAAIRLGDGDDQARAIGDLLFAEVDAGPGNDIVGAAKVEGGPGADRISGAQLKGGPGDDLEEASDDRFGATFDEGDEHNGSDLLVGRAGDDTVSYAGRSEPVRVVLDGRANDGAPGENDELRSIDGITGGAGADLLTGDAGPNLIDGRSGRDKIRGRGGDDRLWGHFADQDATPSGDEIVGGPGDDYLGGSRGADLLLPGPGADRVSASGGNDRILARDGAIDEVSCGTGSDRVTLNRLDFIAGDRDPFYGRCERIFRTGTPTPVPLAISRFSQSDALSVIVGCPADLGRRCRGRARARIGRHNHARGFSFPPGRRGYVVVGSSDGLEEGRRATVAVRARDRRGVVRIITRPLRLRSDE